MAVKKGRPEGARNIQDRADLVPSRCVKCQSTKRGPYKNRRVRNWPGIHNGVEYTHVVWRQTKCGKCGQLRVDRAFENWPDGEVEDNDEGVDTEA